MPDNFSFVVPGKLAGCACPGRWGDLRADLSGLARQGIGAVVSLTEDPVPVAALRDSGLAGLHLPVIDYHPPSQAQVDEFVAYVDACLARGVAVAVHCAAGIGRTGTMLACYLVRTGMTADEAMRFVRRERPGSIESPEQEDCVFEYQARRDGGEG